MSLTLYVLEVLGTSFVEGLTSSKRVLDLENKLFIMRNFIDLHSIYLRSKAELPPEQLLKRLLNFLHNLSICTILVEKTCANIKKQWQLSSICYNLSWHQVTGNGECSYAPNSD